jgi:DNA (cytosine-5)-methyltransferase 1
MRHGSLFSGIGGFDLASEWMGWENVFHCEWNPFGQKVLNYYWPKAISYHDITKTDFSIHRGKIDIITGGFPCQPYSMAGKRKGKEDERHLWPEMLRCIREVQPTWIVGENVLGLVNWNEGMVFEEVQADLEAEGYTVQPYVLPAASVNAPHRRDRVWFVAYSDHKGRSPGFSEVQSKDGEVSEWHNNAQFSHSSIQRVFTDSTSISEGTDKLRSIRSKDEEIGREGSQAIYNATRSNGFEGDATYSECKGLQGCTDYREVRSKKGEMGREGDKLAIKSHSVFNQSNASDSEKQRLEGMRREKGGYSELCGGFYGIQDWQNFPTSSPICSRNDGISDRLDSITFSKWRAESIKAGGNAIVPQVVHQIFKAIQQYNDLEK